MLKTIQTDLKQVKKKTNRQSNKQPKILKVANNQSSYEKLCFHKLWLLMRHIV